MKSESISADGIFSENIEIKIRQQTTSSPSEQSSSRDELCPINDMDCEEPTGSIGNVAITDEEKIQKSDVVLVLFWMQGCAHCEEVLTTVLPNIESTYQDLVAVFPIELKEIETIDTFYAMAERLGVTKNNIGVPLIIIADQVLTGDEIKQKLSSLIDSNLKVDEYKILAIPEFEDRLPPSVQDLEKIYPENSQSSTSVFPFPRIFLVGFIIGVPVLVLGGIIISIIRKKH